MIREGEGRKGERGEETIIERERRGIESREEGQHTVIQEKRRGEKSREEAIGEGSRREGQGI